jgi:hypothetical protein
VDVPREDEALAHAGPDGHVCGREPSLRVVAVAARRAIKGAEHVFVTPTHTFVVMSEEVVRYENGPDMREAFDTYLLTGRTDHMRDLVVDLLAPTDPAPYPG